MRRSSLGWKEIVMWRMKERWTRSDLTLLESLSLWVWDHGNWINLLVESCPVLLTAKILIRLDCYPFLLTIVLYVMLQCIGMIGTQNGFIEISDTWFQVSILPPTLHFQSLSLLSEKGLKSLRRPAPLWPHLILYYSLTQFSNVYFWAVLVFFRPSRKASCSSSVLFKRNVKQFTCVIKNFPITVLKKINKWN